MEKTGTKVTHPPGGKISDTGGKDMMAEAVQIKGNNGEATSTGASMHLVQDHEADITMDGKEEKAADR
jgi:hypothetical protein